MTNTSTITFANGTVLPTIAVHSSVRNVQSAMRNTMEIRIEESATTFEQLKELTTSENLSEVVLTQIQTDDEAGVQEFPYNYTNYTIYLGHGKKIIDNIVMWVLEIAQKTQLEITQEEQTESINDTQLAIIELAGIVTGGIE